MNSNQDWNFEMFMATAPKKGFGDEYVRGDGNITTTAGLQDFVISSQYFKILEFINVQRRKIIHQRKELTRWRRHFDWLQSSRGLG
ncbi:uncharacterized protein N7496_002527 [Penicillium cataractarum]|uniref:Uncharacterized protein n=1 Tax=Penicillium cataractarum TaxID=2100454 RepID=A0A9W9SLY8_9EURO|nr:uncharacterized protein N7496_002527 [Penicillium cataractarum]KAJ5380099.1 hypothetical protein N7496_002527 [Penicillium cataractarum]